MDYANKAPWMKVAHSLKGTKENPAKGLSNKVIVDWWSELRYGGIKEDDTAWCSGFIALVMKRTDPSFSHKTSALLSQNPAYSLNWVDYGTAKARPTFGTIGFWENSPNSRGEVTGHVTLIVGTNISRDTLYCLGGNQGNEVNISSYPIARFLGKGGFRNPPSYDDSHDWLPIYTGPHKKGGRTI